MTAKRKQPPRGAARVPKKARFAREYVIDRNAAAAARRCGFSSSSAKQLGYTLLKDSVIKAEIADLEKEIAARADLSADALVAETHRIAFDESQPTPSRVRALEMLLRITGKLVDRSEWSGPNGGPLSIDITDVRQRLAGRLARIASGN